MRCFLVAVSGLLVLSFALPSAAQDGYQLPPQAIVDIIDARPEPGVSISPDSQWMMLVERDAMPGIADVSRRKLQLAGMRIDPAANGPFQVSYSRGLALRPRKGGDPVRIPIAAGARISGVSWSHRSTHFAFTIATDQGSELWVGSVQRPDQPRLLTSRLSLVLGDFDWMPDGQRILCHLVPESRGHEPTRPDAPTGPNVQESAGNTSPIRTYQDLLQTPHDEALFEYYGRSQLALIDLDGKIELVGKADLIDSAVPSPSGQFLLVTTVHPQTD